MDANDDLLDAYARSLRIKRRSARTVQNYTEALNQLIDHHGGTLNLAAMTKTDVEGYLLEVVEQHSASTVGNRFRALRAFYNWLVDEEEIDRSPMKGMSHPTVTEQPVPVVDDDTIRALLKACGGKTHEDRRDTALIRLWCEPGSPRVSEMAGLTLDDVDMRRQLVTIHGKGDKVRAIPFGDRTGQALSRYLRVRREHKKAGGTDRLWLGTRGPMTASGLYQTMEGRCAQAGIPRIHPHQFRHTSAHQWKLAGGSEEDAMALFGWSSPDMPRRYGASANVDRAQRAARKLSPADRL